MANRFWVGGTGTWNGTAGTKWATTSGGAGGASAPTLADDVFFDAASGGVTVTTGGIAGNSQCRSMTFTGFTGTLSLTNIAGAIILGDASGGAMVFSSSMGVTIGGTTTTIQNQSTSNNGGAGWNITTAGKTMPGLTFNGAGGKWTVTDSLTVASTSTLTLTNGELDTNGKTCSWGIFALGAGTKTLTLGASSVTITGASWTASTNGTNFTLNAGTSSLIFNPTAAIAPIFNVGTNLTYYDVSCIKSSGGFTLSDIVTAVTFHNLTLDNTVVGSGNRSLQITNGITININGTLTYKAFNASSSRGRMITGVQGTSSTIALGASGSAALTDIDLEDIAFTGTSTPVTAASGRLGDCGGNSGITFDAPVTYYWIGDGGSMNSTTHYSTTSGGSTAGVVPLVHDTLVFDSNSISSGSQTINNDMMRMCGIDFTGVTNNPTYNPLNPNGASNLIFGNFILVSGMGYTCTGAAGGAATHAFRKRSGTSTINLAGIDNPNNVATNIAAPGGTYQLASNFVSSNSSGFTHTAGEFDANDYNVTAVSITSSNSNTRTLKMGNGTWTLTGSGTVWQFSTMTNLTFVSEGSTLVISDVSTASKTFAHGSSLTMNHFEVPSSSSEMIFGANSTSWNNFTVTGVGAKMLTFTAGGGSATTIRGNFSATGTNNGYQYMPGVSGNYVSIPDSAALSITGDIDLRCRVALDDWTPPANSGLISKGAGTNYAYRLYLTSNGRPHFVYTNDGTTVNDATATAAPSFTDGQIGWIRATYATATGTVTFYTASGALTSPSAGDWTALGTTVALTSGTIFDSTAVVEIGTTVTGTSGLTTGKFYRVQILNGIAGTVQLDVDFTSKAFGVNTFTESSSNGATVSINGGQAQVGDGRIEIQSSTAATHTLSKASGVVAADYLRLTNSTATGGAGWYAGTHSVDVSGNSGWNFSSPSTDYTSNPADAPTVTDAKAFSIGANKAETPSVHDVVSFSISKTLADSPTVSDNAAKSVGKTATDTPSVTDVFSAAVDKIISDTGVTSDQAASVADFVRAVNESVLANEIFTPVSSFLRGFSDNATVADLVSTSNAAIIAQAIGIILESDENNIVVEAQASKRFTLEADDNNVILQNEVI